MCITFILFTPQHVVKHRQKTPNIYVNEYFYRFVKNFFCKLRKIFFKKLLTFFAHGKDTAKSAGLFSGNCQILSLFLKLTIVKILLQNLQKHIKPRVNVTRKQAFHCRKIMPDMIFVKRIIVSRPVREFYIDRRIAGFHQFQVY